MDVVIALLLAQIIGAQFEPCGFVVDDDGETRFARALNIKSVIVVPSSVSEVMDGYASDEDHLECSVIIFKNGRSRYVAGSIDEVWQKLRKASQQ